MYKCNKCKQVFEYASSRLESRGECYGEPSYENEFVCPFCESEDYEEAILCDGCGEEKTVEDISYRDIGENGKNFCYNCASVIKARFERVVWNEFFRDEEELLEEMNFNDDLFDRLRKRYKKGSK